MTKDGLRDYILRALGAPVINVEVDTYQLDDRIDDAVQFFIERHHDGIEEIFTVYGNPDHTRNLRLPDNVVGVRKLLTPQGDLTTSGEELESFHNQIFNSPSSQWNTSNVVGGYMSYMGAKHQLNNLEYLLGQWHPFEFNNTTKILRLTDSLYQFNEVPAIIYQAVDPDDADTDLYGDIWLKKYAVGLARKQQGVNLMKYNGTTLPGGQTLNADGILDLGQREIDAALEEFQSQYEMPALPVIA